MKKSSVFIFFVVLSFLIISIVNACEAQHIDLKRDDYDRSIYLYADTITVKQGFEILQIICKGKTWNRRVIKNDTTYLRFGVSVFKKIYRIEGKKYVRVKEYEL